MTPKKDRKRHLPVAFLYPDRMIIRLSMIKYADGVLLRIRNDVGKSQHCAKVGYLSGILGDISSTCILVN